MRVPDFVLKGSAFLVSIAGDTGGDLEHDFVASGFFVAVASPNQPNRHHDYFVTAAHSLRDYIRYGIRVNLWGGGIAVIPVERWYTHPNDPQADVAIAEFLVKPEYD